MTLLMLLMPLLLLMLMVLVPVLVLVLVVCPHTFQTTFAPTLTLLAPLAASPAQQVLLTDPCTAAGVPSHALQLLHDGTHEDTRYAPGASQLRQS